MPTNSTFDRKYGWGTSGTLTTGATNKFVTMQAVFPETGTYTVTFSKGNNPASNDPIFAEALITWSVEGNYVTRRVNVGDGVSVSGTAQAVKIMMIDATSSIFGPPNGVHYGVACQVAPGVRGSNKQPPTLVPITDATGGSGVILAGSGYFVVGAGGFDFIDVPQDAGAISLYTTAGYDLPVNDGLILIAQLYGGTAVKLYDPRNFPDWVPLTSGADQIKLINSSGADVGFGLSFGIDG